MCRGESRDYNFFYLIEKDVCRGKETGMDVWTLQLLHNHPESLGVSEPVAIVRCAVYSGDVKYFLWALAGNQRR